MSSSPCIQQRCGSEMIAGYPYDILPSPISSTPVKTYLKRKRGSSIDEQVSTGCRWKKDRPTIDNPTTSSLEDDCHPIAYWAKHNEWPRNFAEMDPGVNDLVSRKRSWTSSQLKSYAQGVKDGVNPRAYSMAHEDNMIDFGLIMSVYQTHTTITDECRMFCKTLLVAEYDLPLGALSNVKTLSKVLERVQSRNEARVVRDITPMVVPSAEMLDMNNEPGLEHITESMNVEWDKCATLCGPKPKPDLAVGMSSSTFTVDQKNMLRMHHTASCPNLFPEGMYFPFLVCEVKSSDRPIEEAERQAMHSASIAVNAQVQLYRKISRADELNRKILVISVSHDSNTVKIFGHFPLLEGDKITFLRHRIYKGDFADDLATNAWKPYHIVRAIYQNFYPIHSKRMLSAIADLYDQPFDPFAFEFNIGNNAEETGSQRLPSSALSSPQGSAFKRPSLPSTSVLQQQNDRLLISLRQGHEYMMQQKEVMGQEMMQQKEMMGQEMMQQKEKMEQEMMQQKEKMEQERVQQKEDQRVQRETMEREMMQQKEKMEREMMQQKEDQRVQRETMERQMVQIRQQMEQQKEVMDLLKQSMTR